jgi:hypothetical protein
VLVAMRLRHGDVRRSLWMAACSAALVILPFLWATSIGGHAVEERFSGLIDAGILASYQQNRGIFLDYTLNDLLFRFPFGAGLGRWGMMQVYFPDRAMSQAPPSGPRFR